MVLFKSWNCWLGLRFHRKGSEFPSYSKSFNSSVGTGRIVWCCWHCEVLPLAIEPPNSHVYSLLLMKSNHQIYPNQHGMVGTNRRRATTVTSFFLFFLFFSFGKEICPFFSPGPHALLGRSVYPTNAQSLQMWCSWKGESSNRSNNTKFRANNIVTTLNMMIDHILASKYILFLIIKDKQDIHV